jgi:hypothetical protein
MSGAAESPPSASRNHALVQDITCAVEDRSSPLIECWSKQTSRALSNQHEETNLTCSAQSACLRVWGQTLREFRLGIPADSQSYHDYKQKAPPFSSPMKKLSLALFIVRRIGSCPLRAVNARSRPSLFCLSDQLGTGDEHLSSPGFEKFDGGIYLRPHASRRKMPLLPVLHDFF